MNLIIMGSPGTGKGTIATYIKEEFGYRHISTGDILRAKVKKGTPLGKKVEPLLNRGEYVGDEIVAKIVREALNSPSAKKGAVLDGYPRTLSQAKELAKILEELNKTLDFVLYLDTKNSVIIERLSARRQCMSCKAIYGLAVPPKEEGICDACGGKLYLRDDDRPEVIKKRLEVYKEKTAPIIDFYKNENLLEKVDANRDLPSILKDVKTLIKSKEKSKPA